MMYDSGAIATAPISSRQINIHMGATICDPLYNQREQIIEIESEEIDKNMCKTIKPKKTSKLHETPSIKDTIQTPHTICYRTPLRSSTKSDFSIKPPGRGQNERSKSR